MKMLLGIAADPAEVRKRELAFELYCSLSEQKNNNFHALLFRLIQKADSDNLHKLNLAFPEELELHLEWQESDPEVFWKKYDIKNNFRDKERS